ncbi:DUF3231 family protein [Sporolactobacillus putidus]|uniref:DUF3231 family protein n=1 Tax=Sporolactobacillus putidus TaxID=492735 RepID=A0A917W4M5_9BACL|nr:DUF3231 family protein [Sporolactobacillus putidus]GGL62928.1 hypothetical protein GCM10007968_28580 [Sporolactobacillus putidus]
MPNVMEIAGSAIQRLGSFVDTQKLPITIGEAMSCWTYSAYLDGVIVHEQIALNTTKDRELLQLFKDAVQVARSHKKEVNEFMKQEGIVMPEGTQDKPVSDPDAIPNGVKFSDKELINTLQINLVAAMNECALFASESVRTDIGLMFFKFQVDKMLLGQQSKKLAQKKGWFQMPPAYNSPGLD